MIELDDERSDGEASKISSFFWNNPEAMMATTGTGAPNSTGVCLTVVRV
jgi:hypothetical protein